MGMNLLNRRVLVSRGVVSWDWNFLCFFMMKWFCFLCF